MPNARCSSLQVPPAIRRRSLLGCCAVAFVFGRTPRVKAAPEEPEFLVIVHPENRTSSASRDLLTRVFLKNTLEWRNGEPAYPIDLRADSAVRGKFSKKVLRRSVTAVKSYWQQRIFSGRGLPPPELESEEAAVRYVLAHRGAVAYVAANTNIGQAKILGVE